MKIFISPDSFKGTLTAQEVANTLKEAWSPYGHEISTFPFSDGGDGFLSSIEALFDTRKETVNTFDTYHSPISAYYLVHENTAYIESATVVGIGQIPEVSLDIMTSSAYGLGLLIADAIQKGYNPIYLGLGGTATHDLGLSIIQALGAKFYNENTLLNAPLRPSDLAKITAFSVNKQPIHITLLTDVSSPLCGEFGAANLFAKQKGANNAQIATLETQGKRLLSLFGMQDQPGFGAAGGMALGLRALCDVDIKSGAEFLLKQPAYSKAIQHADMVVTGEGKFDRQTALGKAPYQVHAFAKSFHKTTVGVFGSKDSHVPSFFDYTYALTDHVSLAQAMNTPQDALNIVARHIAKDMNF